MTLATTNGGAAETLLPVAGRTIDIWRAWYLSPSVFSFGLGHDRKAGPRSATAETGVRIDVDRAVAAAGSEPPPGTQRNLFCQVQLSALGWTTRASLSI
ncbi:MAG: hypothetical protein H6924_12400 [Alphaproteobacteria bacterium]|nr:hypothetical protein [Alphaproteobacteria bacterium]